MLYKEINLEFSLDYNGECEDINSFLVDGKDLSDDVQNDSVDEFVEKLLDLDDFYVSDHLTEVQVIWKDGKMSVFFRYFNEPEDGEFDYYELKDLDPIEFVWDEGEDEY